MALNPTITASLVVLYRGYQHLCLAVVGDCSAGTSLHIYTSQLPSGYDAEHSAGQIDLFFQKHCLVAQDAPLAKWHCTEVVDIDTWAGAGIRMARERS